MGNPLNGVKLLIHKYELTYDENLIFAVKALTGRTAENLEAKIQTFKHLANSIIFRIWVETRMILTFGCFKFIS